uniref:Uncharacterized protein n=1 Tax=Acrobeloides nanus TaxID=290746 RepID=A0A914C8G2_9BILA
MIPIKFLCLFNILWLISSIEAKVDTQHQDHVIIKDTAKHSEKEHKGSEHLEPRKIYQQLLKTKRTEQINSVKTLLTIGDPKKQKHIVDELDLLHSMPGLFAHMDKTFCTPCQDFVHTLPGLLRPLYFFK